MSNCFAAPSVSKVPIDQNSPHLLGACYPWRARECHLNDFRVATEQQLFHLNHRLLGIPPVMVVGAVKFWPQKIIRLSTQMAPG